MFAFAVWDERRRRLVLGRDRVGKKPLYYWCSGGRLVFGSEIKALFADPAGTAAPGRHGVELDLVRCQRRNATKRPGAILLAAGLCWFLLGWDLDLGVQPGSDEGWYYGTWRRR